MRQDSEIGPRSSWNRRFGGLVVSGVLELVRLVVAWEGVQAGVSQAPEVVSVRAPEVASVQAPEQPYHQQGRDMPG